MIQESITQVAKYVHDWKQARSIALVTNAHESVEAYLANRSPLIKKRFLHVYPQWDCQPIKVDLLICDLLNEFANTPVACENLVSIDFETGYFYSEGDLDYLYMMIWTDFSDRYELHRYDKAIVLIKKDDQ